MKTLTAIIAAIQIVGASVAIAASAPKSPALPVNEELLVEAIEVEAAYYSFETDYEVCGGEVTNLSLTDEQSPTPTDSNHYVTYQFNLSLAQNYCEFVSTTFCSADLAVSTDGTVTLTRWDCDQE